MFYETYLEQEPEMLYENLEDTENLEDEYRQDRMDEMVNKFGGY